MKAVALLATLVALLAPATIADASTLRPAFLVSGSTALFTSRGTSGLPVLFKTNGQLAGTSLVKDQELFWTTPPDGFALLGNKILFAAGGKPIAR